MSIIAQDECESIAYPENILRAEILHDGTLVYSTYNMKHEQTALSYFGLQATMKGAHA
jgi:hypothetical protein